MNFAYNRRVLVVDDDAEIRSILRTALDARALVVDEAAGGGEAIESVRSARYSVVLLDIAMPDVDGHAVLSALNATASERPVVLVVSGADRTSLARLDSTRIHGIVRKPFDPIELAALVEACVEIRGRTSYDTMALATMAGGATLFSLL